MKLDLLSMLKMIEEEDKKLEENKLPLVQKEQKTALDLQGLFSLFEEIEPTINVFREDETENLEGFKNVEMTLKVPRAHLTSKMGNRGTEDYKYFAQLIRGLTGGNPTPVGVFKKISELQQVLLKGTDKNLSISQNVSAMVLMEAIYSFFNGFYTIGGNKTEEGVNLGFFTESLAAALYGAKGTIPSNFANSELLSLADLMDPKDNIPVSLKSIKNLTATGSKFFLLHDLVKYGRIYFDLFEKSAPGSSNIYSVIFKRYTITLEDYKDKSLTYEGESDLIKELESIYKSLNENQDLLGEVKGSSRHKMIFKSLYNLYTKNRSDFEEKLEKIEELISDDEKDYTENVKPHKLEDLQLPPERERNKFSPEPILQVLKRVSKGPYSEKVKELQSSYEEVDPKTIKRNYDYGFRRSERSETIDKHFLSLFGELKNYIPTFAKKNTGDRYDLLHYINEKSKDFLEKDLLEKLTNYSTDEKKTVYDILTSEKQHTISKDLQEKLREIWFDMEKKYGLDLTYDDEIKSKMDIYRDTYSDLANQTGENIINQVKKVRKKTEYQQILKQKMPTDFFGIEPSEQAVMNLNPKYLKTIFQNGNDSLEKNYRDLVGKLNQVSELMNKYFLSPEQDGNVGGQLVSNAQEIPDIAEKAIEKTPATGAPEQMDMFKKEE